MHGIGWNSNMETKKLSDSVNLAPESPFGEVAKEASYVKASDLVGQTINVIAFARREYDGDKAYRFLVENDDELMIELTTSSAAFMRLADSCIEQGVATESEKDVYTLPFKIRVAVGSKKNDKGQSFFTLSDEVESDA